VHVSSEILKEKVKNVEKKVCYKGKFFNWLIGNADFLVKFWGYVIKLEHKV